MICILSFRRASQKDVLHQLAPTLVVVRIIPQPSEQCQLEQIMIGARVDMI